MNKTLALMLDKAKTAQAAAYAPYSSFYVGACIRTASGNFFVGCNCENASYGLTQCAEATAIGSMITAGEKQIAEIVIVGASIQPCSPCGGCRQRLREFSTPDTIIHMYGKSSAYLMQTMGELLPYSFGPEYIS